jgi:hypothetical protein
VVAVGVKGGGRRWWATQSRQNHRETWGGGARSGEDTGQQQPASPCRGSAHPQLYGALSNQHHNVGRAALPQQHMPRGCRGRVQDGGQTGKPRFCPSREQGHGAQEMNLTARPAGVGNKEGSQAITTCKIRTLHNTSELQGCIC